MPAAERLPEPPPANYALREDVSRPYGDYQYVPQKGLYRDVTFGDATEDVSNALRGVGLGVRAINQSAGWNLSPTLGDFTFISRGAGAFYNGLGAEAWWGSSFNGNSPDYLTVMIGPLVMDNFITGYGAIYSDLNGTIPGLDNLPPDDRWIHVIWLSFRASILLGESISISLQPFLYYLPNTNEVGWAIPGPLAGTGLLSQLGTSAFAEITWSKDVGTWRLAAYDQFSPFGYGGSLFGAFAGGTAGWGDLSPVDLVGRYSVGYGIGDVTNYNPQSGYGGANLPDAGLGGFYNLAGFRAFGQHGYRTSSMFYIDRIDVWDDDFRHLSARLIGGAYIRNGDSFFSSWAGYNFTTAEPWQSVLHWAVAGARRRFTPSIAAYAEVGYYWQTGDEASRIGEGMMGLIGIQQQLGVYTAHQTEAGRRVFNPARSATGIEDYIQYGISHRIGLKSTLSAVAGISERRILSNIENDHVVKYANVVFTTSITPRLSATAMASWEHAEVEASQYEVERWLYRFSLLYSLSRDIQAQAIYQYEDAHGSPNINYSEHYIYLGVSKRF